jgi:ActR/RegA family two-component response regulator
MESRQKLLKRWDEARGTRWILVSDELPDEEMLVLICYHDVENAVDAISLGYVFYRSTWHDENGVKIDSPDYWMPLPHPPAT